MDSDNKAPIRILLVEDSPVDAELILLQLKKDGLEVDHKRVETEDDFNASLSWTPDLILSDYSLPYFSGVRALQIIRERKLDIPFILVSGAVDEETIINAFKQGADDYVMKSHPGRLGSAIHQAFEQKRLRDEKRLADDALRASEARLELFFAQSLDGFFFMMLDEPVRWDDTVDKEQVLDYVFSHQRITKINDALLAQYRATREQFIGRTPSDLFSHDLKQGRKVWRDLFDARHMAFVTDERRFDGSQMWVEGDYVCMYDRDGKITGHFGIQRDITERRQAEEKLRQLSLAVEQSPATIVITDTHGNIQYVNPKFTQTTGYTADEVIGRNPRILKSGHTSPDVYKKMWETLISGEEWRGELRNKKKNGNLYWEAASISPIFNDQGEITHFIGVKEEVTARKQAEEDLRKAEIQYRTLAEQIPPIVYIAGVEEYIGVTYISPRIELLGFTQDEWIANPDLWLRQVHPDDRKRVLDEIEEKKTHGKPFKSEYRIKARDGRMLWFLDESMDVFDDQGNLLYYQGFMLDITARKQAEEALRRSEARYRAVIENQTEFVVRWKPDGVRTFVNEAYCRYFGITVEQALSSGFLDLVAEEDRKSVEEKSARLLSGAVKSETETHRVIKPDGSIGWQEWVDHAIYDEQGRIAEIQSVGRDVTERKIAEENLRSQNEYLGLLNEITRTILLSNDYESTMPTLASNLKKIIDADDCYITRWDEERQITIPVATTAKLDMPYGQGRGVIDASQIDMTISVLNAGHALAVEDVFNSPYINIDVAKRYPARSALGVPLIVGEHKLGAAIIAFNTPHQFTATEIERAEQAGNQVALALREFQQGIEIQRRLNESNALANIGRALGETERVGTDKVLQLIVDSALELIQQAEEAVIHLMDQDVELLIPRAISGFDASAKASERHTIGLKEGIAGHVIATGKTINVGNINDSPLYVRKQTEPNYRSLLVSPVQSGGHPIGTISVQSNEQNAFSASDAQLLNSLSILAAVAIENTHLFETTQQSLREVNALYLTSQELTSSLDTDELIANVVDILQSTFGYYHAQIYLRDPVTGDLVLKNGSGKIGARLVEMRHHMPAGTGIVGHVAEIGTPFATNNVTDVMFFARNPILPDTQSELAVPVKVDGNVVAVLDVQDKPPHRLTENDLQLMVAVADQLSVALQKANLYANLQTALQQEQTIRSQLVQSERLALVGRLLASVSHELNNPLQAIQNALFLLKGEEQLSPQGQQDLDVILSEAERMASLIERLRSAYRPGRIKDFRPVDLNNLIEDVHTLIATFLRQKKISFELHPEPELPPVSGMSDQMRQVVLNLFLNAIEVMKPGGRLVVRTRYLIQQNEILLTVKDTGPGIDPEILPRIFEAFITGKQSGTGLGLTITRDIIEQHFGRIEAENDPEGGAIFNVWLPANGKGQE